MFVRRVASVCVLGLCVAGCVPPAPSQLAPERLLVRGQAPADILRGVVSRAAAAGWIPVVSDVNGGTVVVRQQLTGAATRGPLACAWQPGSISETHAVATVMTTVQATADSAGTAVTSATRVHVEFPSLSGIMAKAPSDTDCASTGRLEDAILGPLRAKKFAGVP